MIRNNTCTYTSKSSSAKQPSNSKQQRTIEKEQNVVSEVVGEWLCGVCHGKSFTKYEDACRHEMICGEMHGFFSEQKQRTNTKKITKGAAQHHHQHQQDTTIPTSADLVHNVFIRSANTGHWNCPHCCNVPLMHRAPGSVSRSYARPTAQFIEMHLQVCCGNAYYQPPVPPVAAAIEYGYDCHHQEKSSSNEDSFHLNKVPGAVALPAARQVSRGQSCAIVSETTYYTAPHHQQQARYNTHHHHHHHHPYNNNGSPVIMRPILSGNCHHNVHNNKNSLTARGDANIITEYFHYLLDQYQSTIKTSSDCNAANKNIPLGHPGIVCRHCMHSNGARPKKFFASNVDKLAQSCSTSWSKHLAKCVHCPSFVVDHLARLKREHCVQMARLPRGCQKVFLRRLWRRLQDNWKQDQAVLHHAPSNDNAGIQESSSTSSPPLTTSFANDISQNDDDDDISVASDITMDPAISAQNVLFVESGESTDPNGASPRVRVLLGVSDDADWLSDADCLIRRNLEVFCCSSASDDDDGSDRCCRVGIQCVHCSSSSNNINSSSSHDDNKLSCKFYPQRVETIYEEVKDFAKHHFPQCPHMPASVRTEFAKLPTMKTTLAVLLKRHYKLGARIVLGLENAGNSNEGVIAREGSVLHLAHLQKDEECYYVA
eukprot:CAMPEP_0196816668 /NCGR_PEP_ID=MMETSP1362-20130617/56649_1 /TAXON_ID=163516 /ORGANISM="Leptocylindrus danicus, Strain CCMP1856" /LENGTH=655 /DNA_ID=CAMNT_0042194101 /DNA_START=118 /DNA_END=2088 /DNA_ORIENTATION=+